MKKFCYLFIFVFSVLFLSHHVSADSILYSNFYDTFSYSSSYLTTYSSQISDMQDYWESNYSSFCPYYVITWSYESVLSLRLSCVSNIYFSKQYPSGSVTSSSIVSDSSDKNYAIWYDTSSDTYTYYPNVPARGNVTFVYDNSPQMQGVSLLYANFDPIFLSTDYLDNIYLPSYSDSTYNFSSYSIFNNNILPTVSSLVANSYAPDSFSNYTDIDLSNYDYVVLSLKNYNVEPFSVTLYSLGSLCLTPVYNYGMTQKNTYYSGYQVQACSENYTVSTPVNIYILESDISNHAVYYLKASDSFSNIVKVPTDIFDITYFNVGDSDPQVVIGGRSYPVIPFSDLTDTANKSTEEGYISGRVCALGDLNCQAEAAGMDISNLFTHPLELLQDMWTAITSVFTVITAFITLLPVPLQTFMYIAFMFAVILGILKIIIG